jgi:uncharacterized membrane protein
MSAISKLKKHQQVGTEYKPVNLQTSTQRITSIDLLRGIVMIIMALDHTRDFFHYDVFFYDPTNLEKTNPALFFTRFITHYCAPTFVFLSGTSAFLMSQRKTKKELSLFLLTRGLWMLLLELTVINFGWYFDIHFTNLFDLSVFWALGGSMIALAGLIFLPLPLIISIGLIIIFGHNLLDNIHIPGDGFNADMWGLLHDSKPLKIFGRNGYSAYPILPWIGVMALGYCLGRLYTRSVAAEKRKRILITLGLVSIILFMVLRLINVYGDLKPWSEQPTPMFTFLSFLNVWKYPPSLLFVLLTLGPGLLFLAFAEKPLNRLTSFISTFGRVPLFYYILHLYLLHLLGMVAAEFTGYDWRDMVLNIWLTEYPGLDGYGFSLGIVYLVWIGVIVLLYPLCKWYDKYKMANKKKWWLSYL